MGMNKTLWVAGAILVGLLLGAIGAHPLTIVDVVVSIVALGFGIGLDLRRLEKRLTGS
jgi:hypothetical protein